MANSEANDEFELPWRRRGSSAPALGLYLVIVWSLEEPERIGQSAALVEGAWLGRGEPEPDEIGVRLQFGATRDASTSASWLEASRLSRRPLGGGSRFDAVRCVCACRG